MFAPFPRRDAPVTRAKAKVGGGGRRGGARQKAEAEKEAAQAKQARAQESEGLLGRSGVEKRFPAADVRQLHPGHPGAAAVLRRGQNLCRQLSTARRARRGPLHRGNLRDRQNAPRGRHRLAAHRLRRPGRLPRRPATCWPTSRRLSTAATPPSTRYSRRTKRSICSLWMTSERNSVQNGA